jgi:hypothetical protein
MSDMWSCDACKHSRPQGRYRLVDAVGKLRQVRLNGVAGVLWTYVSTSPTCIEHLSTNCLSLSLTTVFTTRHMLTPC